MKAIKAKGLSKQAKVQVLHMDDYFGDNQPYTSSPISFGTFMQELADDMDLELQKDGVTGLGEDGEKMNLLDLWYEGSGDGNENFTLLTIVDGRIVTIKG